MIRPGKKIVDKNSVPTLIVHDRKYEIIRNGLNNRLLLHFQLILSLQMYRASSSGALYGASTLSPPVLIANMVLGHKCLAVQNTLAYYLMPSITYSIVFLIFVQEKQLKMGNKRKWFEH